MIVNIGKSPLDIKLELAERFRKQRLLKNLTREELSEKSGVAATTIKKYETTGDISLKYFLLLAESLEHLDDIVNLMKIESPKTVAELKNSKRTRARKCKQ